MVVYRATPADVTLGRPGRRRRVSAATPRAARAWLAPTSRRKVAFFALLHDQDLNDADRRLRARRGRQRSRRPRLSTRSSRSRSAAAASRSTTGSCSGSCPEILAHSPELGRAAAVGRPGAGVREDQQRPAATERRRRSSSADGAHVADAALDGIVRPARQRARSKPASPTTGPISTRARKSTSRCTSGSTSRSPPRIPVMAANAGKVLLAEWLGIYGNCVILDHGMGVASLYGHLSSLDVKARRRRHEGPGARTQRHDRARRRRPPALHDARQRARRSIPSNGGIRTGFRTASSAS